MEAGDIEVGDYVTLQNGEVVAVQNVAYTVLETPIKAYDFTVEGLHNYYVGELENLWQLR
ncbi:MAG: polymorphic toxin-type HINT domain-containing protein [Cellulosilyticaceae bacterium]